MNKLPEKPPIAEGTEFGQALSQIQGDPELKKAVVEYNVKYLSWDEVKHRIPDPQKRRSVWFYLKMLRTMQYEYVPYQSLSLRYSFTPEILRALHLFDQHLSGIIQIHNKTLRLEKTYIINSLMEEAIASSILEGAATTHRVAKEMLRKGTEPKNRGERMVLNNYRAMQYIFDQKDASLTPEFILNIHRFVTEETMDDTAVGRFREDNGVAVADAATGTIHHIPPDHTRIQKMIEEMCRFAGRNNDEDETFIHPIIKGAILHFLIGYIHPFSDGNGRTARSIFYWYVISQGYWLFEYMPLSQIILKSKKKYALAYLYPEYDEMDLTYFIQYTIRCIEAARKDLFAYIERKQSEQNGTKAIISTIRDINQRQAEILRHMMEHSDEYFTIREIMSRSGVVYQTARTDLLGLVDLGYLLKEKRGREFLFIFNEQSDLWKGDTTSLQK